MLANTINPTEGNLKIWRYMDFTKFMSMLNNESLFFTRADKFNDPFEGKSTLLDRQSIFEQVKTHTEEKNIENPEGEARYIVNSFDQFLELQRRITLVQCWHLNEYESTAMWDLYLKSGEGIAIQSRFNYFCDVLESSESTFVVKKVNYIDYENDYSMHWDVNSYLFYKRKSFEHEKELRAIKIANLPQGENGIDVNFQGYCDVGEHIPIDLSLLIENIYISPTSSEWFYDLVVEMCKKFGLDKPVIKSRLNELPY